MDDVDDKVQDEYKHKEHELEERELSKHGKTHENNKG